MPSIYLAGKIARGDWRHEILRLDGAWTDYLTSGMWTSEHWPVLTGAVFGLDYTGPYFVESCHGMAHGPQTHGCNGQYQPAPDRFEVIRLCFDAIKRSDIVFAWLDANDLTAYGTLVELGYAKALGKKIIIGSQSSPGQWVDETGGHGGMPSDVSPVADLWFAFMLDRQIITDDPVAAVRKIADLNLEAIRYQALEKLIESPIELAFWQAHLRAKAPELQDLIPQHPVLNGRYRLDFALPASKVAIELDGYAYHSSKDAFVKDRARQRTLEAAGWRVIRFAGSEITTNAAACVAQAISVVRTYTTT